MKDTRAYTYGEAPLGIVHGRDTVTFHTDAIGSVVELSDDHGQIADSYRYTPFGESYGPGESDEAPAETSENPIRYAGQYLDYESGLYDMRAREYESRTGRFLQVDPIEAGAGDTYTGSYVYVQDQPTVMTDPSGMCPLSPEVGKCEPGWRWPNILGWNDAFGNVPPKAGFNGQIGEGSNYKRSEVIRGQQIAGSELLAAYIEGKISEYVAIARMQVINRAFTAYGTWYVYDSGDYEGPTPNLGDLGENRSWVRKIKVGFDCSGFVAYAFGSIAPHFGYIDHDPTKHGGTWAEADPHHSRFIDQSQRLPADLLFYGMHHVALYIGQDLTIQAPESYDYVRIKPTGSPSQYRRWHGF